MTTHNSIRRQVLATAIITAITGATNAVASGFAVPEISTAGLGTANALVANPDERGAIAYNPAAMAFHQQSMLSVGGLFLNPEFSVKTASGNHDGTGAEWLVAPMIQAAVLINDKWSAGLGINAPYGLETRWQAGTFPPLTGTAALPPPPFGPGGSVPISPQPTASKLEILDFVPTATYKVNDNLALSAGVDIYWAKSAQLNSTISQMEGDGTGLGFNLSAMYVKDAFSAGINFHSASTLSIDGSYSALNNTLVLIDALQPSQTAELDLDLPWRLQLGARYEVNQKLAVELDWTRTGWSEFQEIKIDGDLNGAVLAQDKNDWEDANAYRLGLTYQVIDSTQLRFGYSYDETGQRSKYFSPRIPDNDRNPFSFGVAHRLADGWQIEAGYMYVMFNDRKISGARPYDVVNAPADINGTTAVAGDYEAHANLFGIEVSKTFDAF